MGIALVLWAFKSVVAFPEKNHQYCRPQRIHEVHGRNLHRFLLKYWPFKAIFNPDKPNTN